MKLTNPAGRIAASSFVPSRETINLSTNCITVKEIVEITMGADSFSIYLSEVSSSSRLCDCKVDSLLITQPPHSSKNTYPQFYCGVFFFGHLRCRYRMSGARCFFGHLRSSYRTSGARCFFGHLRCRYRMSGARCFFGYPTVCARITFWSGRSFITFARAGLSTYPRTTVANPSEAQYR
ncbi:hypothetical protein ES703_117513 [subsurface metagenome]